MSTIQTSSALRVARADLTTTNNTTLYTVPSRYDSIVFSLFKVKAVSANGTVELLSRDLLLTAGDILKVQAATANRLHVVASITEIPS
jgi:hypothetical protein